jgi:hypothetical protein
MVVIGVTASETSPHPNMSCVSRRRRGSTWRRMAGSDGRTGSWDDTAGGTALGFSLLHSARRRRRPGEAPQSTFVASGGQPFGRIGVSLAVCTSWMACR